MGERGKGEVSGQPTARVAYIGKGGPTLSRVIRREKGKKGKACARYGYRYPYIEVTQVTVTYFIPLLYPYP